MQHKHKNHVLLMLLCCLVPLVIIFILPALGFEIGTLGRLASLGIVLICPLMHIGLVALLFKGNKDKNCCSNQEKISEQRL